MSKICVWTTEGKWSEKISGLDKVHLMKSAIRNASIACDSKGEYLEDPFKDYEIDSKPICDCDLYNDEDKYRSDIDWSRLRYSIGGGMGGDKVDFATVCLFKIPLGDLKFLAEEDKVLAPAYNKLIAAAGLPSSSSGNSCLLLKFEEE